MGWINWLKLISDIGLLLWVGTFFGVVRYLLPLAKGRPTASMIVELFCLFLAVSLLLSYSAHTTHVVPMVQSRQILPFAIRVVFYLPALIIMNAGRRIYNGDFKL